MLQLWSRVQLRYILLSSKRGREDYDTEKDTEQDTNITPYIHCIWWVG